MDPAVIPSFQKVNEESAVIFFGPCLCTHAGSLGRTRFVLYNVSPHQSFSNAIVLPLLWRLKAIPHCSLYLGGYHSLLVHRRFLRVNIPMCACGRILEQEHQGQEMREFVTILH